MIYFDSSVVLATVFAEARQPPDAFWQQDLISSRLLEYEMTVRMNVLAVTSEARAEARKILDDTQLLDMSQPVLARALQPFPVPVRTLDGLHLATMDFLRNHGQTLELATYDQRLAGAATALGFALAPL